MQVLNIQEASSTDRLLYLLENTTFERQIDKKNISIDLQVINKLLSKETNQRDIDCCLNELAQYHSIENILYVIAYTAGINKMGIAGISNLSYIHSYKNSLRIKNEMYWFLINAYISGNRKNSFCDNRLSALYLLKLFLMHPQKFIAMPALSKREIIKYFVKTMIGSNVLVGAAINKYFQGMSIK